MFPSETGNRFQRKPPHAVVYLLDKFSEKNYKHNTGRFSKKKMIINCRKNFYVYLINFKTIPQIIFLIFNHYWKLKTSRDCHFNSKKMLFPMGNQNQMCDFLQFCKINVFLIWNSYKCLININVKYFPDLNRKWSNVFPDIFTIFLPLAHFSTPSMRKFVPPTERQRHAHTRLRALLIRNIRDY